MSTHTAIAVIRVGEIEAIKVPTEAPRNGEVLIKVGYSSLIPFDTYMVDLGIPCHGVPEHSWFQRFWNGGPTWRWSHRSCSWRSSRHFLDVIRRLPRIS